MKIGLVTDFYYPWIGGPSACVKNLCRGLHDRGHDVSLLAPSPRGDSYVEMDGPIELTRARTAPVPVGFELRCAVRPLSDTSRWIDRIRPDVVHIHHPFPLSAAALFCARRRDIPVVATNHTVPECSLWGLRGSPRLYRGAETAFTWWLLQLLNRCEAVATPTPSAARAIRLLGFGGHVEPISNGVDTRRFSLEQAGSDLKSRLGLDDRPVVLYTGRLDAEKRMDLWLSAAAALANEIDVQFLIGGKGTDRGRVERLTFDLGIADRVKFFGYLDDAEYPDVYRLAEVFFITSEVELQSICTLEAVASGLPVVAVRAGALPELVRHQQNGYLVEPGDWWDAARRLADVLVDAPKRRKMAAQSRAIAGQHDVTLTIDKYERFLQGALVRKLSEGIGEPAATAR